MRTLPNTNRNVEQVADRALDDGVDDAADDLMESLVYAQARQMARSRVEAAIRGSMGLLQAANLMMSQGYDDLLRRLVDMTESDPDLISDARRIVLRDLERRS